VRLLIVRHGATLNNASGRYTGQSDVELSPLGVRQAEALAARLASEQLDQIVTSDLRRARKTAECIAARHPDVPLSLDADLREISMGEWEGLTHAEVLARDPVRFMRWSDDAAAVAAPGGETYAELHQRVARALDHSVGQCPLGTVLWATHGGAIGILLCHVLGLDLSKRAQFRRDNTAITELVITEGAIVLIRHNDTAHLEHLADDGLSEPSQVL
jgi:alpha-ribazole phosphatase